MEGMTMTRLEHVNITVADPDHTAALFGALFGWHVRWHGPAKNGGRSVHVGEEASYVALYKGPTAAPGAGDNGLILGGLNHMAVVVDDLDACEARILRAGYVTGNHADYEPGRRFYFTEENGIEIEVVQYDTP
jgi:predicted enzyme related to lactoylglutathione lyase